MFDRRVTGTAPFEEGREVMELRIVHPESGYSKATFDEPTQLGYIHIGAEVRPYPLPFTPFTPFIPTGTEKSMLLGRVKECSRRLEALDSVESATVFEAVAMPPFSRLPYVGDEVRSSDFPRFDVAVLIETSSRETVAEVRESNDYRALTDALRSGAKRTRVTTARNEKRIGDVDKSRDGLFIFNHFVAADPTVMLDLFDHLAGWYEAETGLDNSTLLVPLDDEESPYVAINNARWDMGLPKFFRKQVANRSFREFVLGNLKANHVGAMPVLYRRA